MAKMEEVLKNLTGAEQSAFHQHDFSGVDFDELSVQEGVETVKNLLEIMGGADPIQGEEAKINKIHAQIILKESGTSIIVETTEDCILEGGLDMDKVLTTTPEDWKKRLGYIDTNQIAAIVLLRQ